MSLIESQFETEAVPDRPPESSQSPPNLYDYEQGTIQWIDGFMTWRESRDPNDYLDIAKNHQPPRFGFNGPRSMVENLYVRSTNELDDIKVDRVLNVRSNVKGTIKIGQAFYKKGGYRARRDELFTEFEGHDEMSYMQQLYENLAEVINVIPQRSLDRHGFSKLCRTIGGFAFLALGEQEDSGENWHGLNMAMRVGYDVALTYPLMDDLLYDSDYLETIGNGMKRADLLDATLTALSTGSLKGIDIPKNSVTDELTAAFNDFAALLPFAQHREIYNALSALHKAQVTDGEMSRHARPLAYQPEDYVPYIIKAAMTRAVPYLAATHDTATDPRALDRIIGLGLRTQFGDDLTDIHEDLTLGTHTPYSPYIVGGLKDADSPNPLELYLDSIFYSIEHDYDGDHQTPAARAMLGLAAHAIAKAGPDAITQLAADTPYRELFPHLAKRYPGSKAEAKLLSKLDRVALGREQLYKKLDVYLHDLQQEFAVVVDDFIDGTDETFKNHYEHSLAGRAKRIRPALTYMTADTFKVPRAAVTDLALAAELFHTASLVFDDLPAQDNADLRRGRPSLHVEYGEDEAQLAALAMIFDAQKLITTVDAEHALDGSLSSYVSSSLGPSGLCKGQALDLRSKHEQVTTPSLEDLDNYAYLKTGVAIEVSIIGAALLAKLPATAITALQEYSYHAGLVFQIKDDLLDSEDASVTGKTSGSDAVNNKPNYVHLLGIEAATEKMNLHAGQAKQVLEGIPKQYSMRKYIEFIDYLVKRTN